MSFSATLASHLLPRFRGDDLVLPGALGRVERLVGGAEEVVGAGDLVVGQARHAERRRDLLAVREGEGRDDLADPLGVEQIGRASCREGWWVWVCRCALR